MVVYNTQNYLVLIVCPLFGILNTRKHNVSETAAVSHHQVRARRHLLCINFKGSSLPCKVVQPLGSCYVPYVKGVSEKLKCIANHIILRQSSERHKLFGVQLRTRPE
jgi:hypothetical protein